MPTYTSPGSFTIEQSRSLPGVPAVETAVPAFIGYTEKAISSSQDVTGQPVTLSSMTEFASVFGDAPSLTFGLTSVTSAQDADVAYPGGYFRLLLPTPYFRLYRCMQMFFNNGGRRCQVVSAGHYQQRTIAYQALIQGLDVLRRTQATLVVIPEAVSLSETQCYQLHQAMLVHCGQTMADRMALLDIFAAEQPATASVSAFRQQVATAQTGAFGAAYLPWLNTTLVDDSTLDYRVFDRDSCRRLQHAIADEPGYRDRQTVAAIEAMTQDETAKPRHYRRSVRRGSLSPAEIDKTLRLTSATYRDAMQAVARHCSLLPPSSAVAGCIATADSQRGVWKAPANLALQSVMSPAITITDGEQQWLTTSADGKSVNAIRYFAGGGTRLWGARTLAGNDIEWRYISVRRTCIMLEQSILRSLQGAVFEPNDEPLWQAVEVAIGNFLTGLWRQGAFAGGQADEAYFVRCGLGKTMTAADIAAGNLCISIGVAMVRPAQFTVLAVKLKVQPR